MRVEVKGRAHLFLGSLLDCFEVGNVASTEQPVTNTMVHEN